MPANRSRTQRWREQLDLILARGGGLELSLDRSPTADNTPDLVWRVRILQVNDDNILVEMPGAAGASVELPVGATLVAAMSIGQNRWMFNTAVRSVGPMPGNSDRRAMALEAPARVERCRRRNFHRISTATVNLPTVECWPVFSPTSVVAAEIANKAEILAGVSAEEGQAVDGESTPAILPDVGPRYSARLVNISGGGVGLVVGPDDATSFSRSSIVWIRIDLRPRIRVPLGVTARVAHSHRDSEQNIVAGLAFEFQFNPPHRAFVVDQICRYVEAHRQAHRNSAKGNAAA